MLSNYRALALAALVAAGSGAECLIRVPFLDEREAIVGILIVRRGETAFVHPESHASIFIHADADAEDGRIVAGVGPALLAYDRAACARQDTWTVEVVPDEFMTFACQRMSTINDPDIARFAESFGESINVVSPLGYEATPFAVAITEDERVVGVWSREGWSSRATQSVRPQGGGLPLNTLFGALQNTCTESSGCGSD